MRILLRGIGGRQAVGEAGDGGQALLVRSRGRRSHGDGCQEELRRQRNECRSSDGDSVVGAASNLRSVQLLDGQVRSKRERQFAVVRIAQRYRPPAEATEAREPGRNFVMALGRRGRVHLEIGE